MSEENNKQTFPGCAEYCKAVDMISIMNPTGLLLPYELSMYSLHIEAMWCEAGLIAAKAIMKMMDSGVK